MFLNCVLGIIHDLNFTSYNGQLKDSEDSGFSIPIEKRDVGNEERERNLFSLI